MRIILILLLLFSMQAVAYPAKELFAFDLAFFMAKPTIENSFDHLSFLGGQFEIRALTPYGDLGAEFAVGYGRNNGDEIRYDGIRHVAHKKSGGATKSLIFGWPIINSLEHRLVPRIKIGHYDGHSGDPNIEAKDDIRVLYYYGAGIRYEYGIQTPSHSGERLLFNDFAFGKLILGIDAHFHYRDPVAIRTYVGIGIGLFH